MVNKNPVDRQLGTDDQEIVASQIDQFGEKIAGVTGFEPSYHRRWC